ncbi:MAG: hypothetical protein WCX65_15740 [bacterium]
MKNRQSVNAKHFVRFHFIFAFLAIAVLMPSVSFALSTNFDISPPDEGGAMYEKSAPSASEYMPAPAPSAEPPAYYEKKSYDFDADIIDGDLMQPKIEKIIIGNKIVLSEIPASGLLAISFDSKLIKRLPSSQKTKSKLIENAIFDAAAFRSIIEPAIKDFNRMPFSKKIELLYGDIQLSDVVNYGSPDLDKIVVDATKSMGLGVGLAVNIKKYRAASGFTDTYVLNNLFITTAQVDGMPFISLSDIRRSVNTLKNIGSDWDTASPWQRKKMLMGAIIMSNVTKI